MSDASKTAMKSHFPTWVMAMTDKTKARRLAGYAMLLFWFFLAGFLVGGWQQGYYTLHNYSCMARTSRQGLSIRDAEWR